MNADTRSGAARQLDAGSENCLPIGTRLADFEITGVLGEGGFGIVYVAYDHALQRTVAIKEYMPGVLAMRAGAGNIVLRAERHQDTFKLGLKSFINEARLLARFDHPALIKVYRFWEQNNTAYTAMKFYAGRTIKDIVSNSPELVDEAWCRKVLGQILGALDMLYTMRILHRDISPDNIIVQDNGDAVLLDFGSARQIIGDVTRGLTVILKPGYAPVEQYAGDASLEQGPYTDLYALSAVIYFAITKAPPPASIGRMINDPIVALADNAPPGYGGALLAAIDKGLAVLAQDRPQTIAEFRSLLGLAPVEPLPAPMPLAQPQPPSTPQPATPALAAPPLAEPMQPAAAPARRRLLPGVGAAGLLAIAAAGSYAFFAAPGDEDAVAPAQPQVQPAPVPAAPVEAAPPAAEVAAAVAMIAALEENESVVEFPASTVDAGVASAPPKADSERAPPVAEARYKVHIKPWGTVFVDEQPRGVSPPLKQIVLTPGKHTIRIANPNFPDHVMTVTVGKNKSGAIEHDFSAH